MRKATFTIDDLSFDVFFDGEIHFTIESFTRMESVKLPMLDENGNQLFNDIDETEKAPIFYFENRNICRPYKQQIKLNDEMLAEFEKTTQLVLNEEIDQMLEPYFVD